MSLELIDIRHHLIWLTKKAHYRTYRVTRQFDKEDVFASAALTGTSWFDETATTGFVQAVSEAGVEDFGTRTINVGEEDYVGIGAYEAAVLRRNKVTSLTFELAGDGGAAAQFSFFILSAGKSGRDAGSDLEPQSWLGFDAAGELHGIHEFHGDDKFKAAEAERWASRKDRARELTYVRTDPGFKFDPDLVYRLGKKGAIKAEKPPKPKSAKPRAKKSTK